MESRIIENNEIESDAIIGLKSSNEYLTFPKEIKINPYQEFIIRRIILCQEVIEPSNTRKKVLLGLSAFAIATGSLAGLPFVDAILATNTIPVLSKVLAGATVVSFGSGSIWGWLKMLDEFRTKSDEENQLLTRTGKCQLIAISATSVLLGTFSAIPSVYIAYKYNKGLWWPLFNLLTSTGLHTYGYSRAIKSNIKRKIIGHRLFGFFSDYHAQQYIRLKEEENKREILTNLFRIGFYIRGVPKQTLSPDAAIHYCKVLMNDVIRIGIWNITKQANNKKFNQSKLAASLSSLLFPVCFATITSVLSYNGVALFSNSIFVSLLFAILSVIPALAIELIGNTRVFSQFHEKLFGYDSLPHTAVVRDYKFPASIITIFLLIMGIISVLNGAVIANAEIENFFGIPTILLLALSTIGELITKGFMVTDLGLTAAEKGIGLNNDKFKTEVLKEQQVEQLLKILQEGNEESFAEFYQYLLDNPELTNYMETKKQEEVTTCGSSLFHKAKMSYQFLLPNNENDVADLRNGALNKAGQYE